MLPISFSTCWASLVYSLGYLSDAGMHLLEQFTLTVANHFSVSICCSYKIKSQSVGNVAKCMPIKPLKVQSTNLSNSGNCSSLFFSSCLLSVCTKKINPSARTRYWLCKWKSNIPSISASQLFNISKMFHDFACNEISMTFHNLQVHKIAYFRAQIESNYWNEN